MSAKEVKASVQAGLSRRSFLEKGFLATAFAGAWMGTGITPRAEDVATPAVATPEVGSYPITKPPFGLEGPDKNLMPALLNPEGWSMVVIPDTQTYVKLARNQGICELMTAWIAENAKKLNILTTLQVGDLVERNGIIESDLPAEKGNIDQTSAQQWNAISRAMSRLDGKIPYVVCTGNHDYGIRAAENRNTQFPTYFPTNRNSAWQGVLVECCPNRDGVKTLENAAYAFKTPQGKDIMVISLEFAPSDPVLAWAKELVARDAYKNHFVILLTHSYLLSLASGQNRVQKEGYGVADANYGEAIWEKLVNPSENIRMVVCGHIAGTKKPEEDIGFRQDKNSAGKTVSQMLFDTQTLGGGWHGNGGNGWIRLLEFSPDFKTVSVRTFSPFFAICPTTQPMAWSRESYNEFSFNLD